MSSDTQTPTVTTAHYVAPIDETPLEAVDTVRVSEKRHNLWLDAWRDLLLARANKLNTLYPTPMEMAH